MIVWRVSDFFRFKFCYSSKNRHLSGSHNGTPGDWHALLCRGGNLQSREGSSLDGQSWRGFHHVTYGDIRHVDVDVNCMEYLCLFSDWLHIFLPHICYRFYSKFCPRHWSQQSLPASLSRRRNLIHRRTLALEGRGCCTVFPYLSNRQDAKKPDFLARNPTGKAPWIPQIRYLMSNKKYDLHMLQVPYLETDKGCIFTSNAVARPSIRLTVMQGCKVREED